MEKEKKYKVVSIHPYTACPMHCPFCYKKRSAKSDEKPERFWLDMIPYIAELTDQIVMGGGEPLMNPRFVEKMGAGAKQNGVLFNITSNGRLLMKMSDEELKSVLENVTMISLSYDNYKIQNDDDLKNYLELVKRINGCTGCQVGTNLLISKDLMEKGGRPLLERVDMLFRSGEASFCSFP